MFYTEQKVCCIKSSGILGVLVLNNTYTIKAVHPDVIDGHAGLILKETNPPKGYAAFKANRFVPLDEMEQVEKEIAEMLEEQLIEI